MGRDQNVRTVSVCVATFNGADHVREQIESILSDLGPHDEVVVVDDCSTDSTLDILRELAALDSRLKVSQNEINRGHVHTFEAALRIASGDYVALSDQDDVWPLGRTRRLIDALQDNDLAVGNFEAFGARSGPPQNAVRSGDSGRGITNVFMLALNRRAYFGSCMLMRRALLHRALPFPPGVQAHDHWLAILANVRGGVSHLDGEPVTRRRIHEKNLTPRARRSPREVLRTRGIQIGHMVTALGRR